MNQLGIKIRLWLVLPALALLAVLVFAACSVAGMQVPESLLIRSDRMPDAGRRGWTFGKDIPFGEYRLTGIQRDWVTSRSVGLFGIRRSSAHRKYGFRLISPDLMEPTPVQCVTDAHAEDIRLGGSAWSLDSDLTRMMPLAILWPQLQAPC